MGMPRLRPRLIPHMEAILLEDRLVDLLSYHLALHPPDMGREIPPATPTKCLFVPFLLWQQGKMPVTAR